LHTVQAIVTFGRASFAMTFNSLSEWTLTAKLPAHHAYSASMAAPLDAQEFNRWLEQAGSAQATADLARAGGRHDWACFLDEQAAQLAVKGLLHGIGEQAWATI